jgi:enoyl-[acyl-carrier protein] reductase II
MALGAEGVQIGTLFALSKESSASDAFKEYCTHLPEDGTMLAIKKISPTRLIKNALFDRLKEAEDRGADADELRAILGAKAAKRGLFEGDLENGELEIGQIASAITEIKPVSEIMNDLVTSFDETCKNMIHLV